MRFFWAGVALAALGLLAVIALNTNSPPPSRPDAADFQRMLSQSVTIQTEAGSVLGAGWVLHTDGVIVTNTHVVEDEGTLMENLRVRLFSGTTLDVAVDQIHTDSELDVAVIDLRLMGVRLDAAPLADTPAVYGDSVFAIGSPSGRMFYLSEGIVSLPSRTGVVINGTCYEEGEGDDAKKICPRDEVSVPMLMTDAAINKGNSGGPLFNSNGEIIGMVTGTLTEKDGMSVVHKTHHVLEALARMGYHPLQLN